MKQLVAFDLDGTLALSKQPLQPDMGEALADLLGVAHVAVISGGDWPQFDKQVASRLPARADRSRLWLMPTTGTKLYTFEEGAGWSPVYAELFSEEERRNIVDAFAASLQATGFVEHLKLPHYVDFQSELELVRRMRAQAGAVRHHTEENQP